MRGGENEVGGKCGYGKFMQWDEKAGAKQLDETWLSKRVSKGGGMIGKERSRPVMHDKYQHSGQCLAI